MWPAFLGAIASGSSDNFFDLGASSLDLIGIHAKIVEAFGPVLTAVDLFGHPNIKAVGRKDRRRRRRRDDVHVNRRPRAQARCGAAPRATRGRQGRRGMSEPMETEGRIAIIGMSGRFPGARDVAAFWRNLRNGVESVTFFADNELEDGADPATRASPVTSRPARCSPMSTSSMRRFFDMREREAALTDPQHRVFLECAWEALEDAGYDPAAYRGAIGVFAGCSMNTYFLNNVCRDRKAIEDFTGTFQLGDYPVLIGAGREFLATPCVVQAGPAGPEPDRPDRLLDVARRGRAGVPKPVAVSGGHGAGWRRVDLVSAASRLSASGRRHGVGGRSLPPIRRVRQRNDLRQRRGRRPAEAAGGRDRRRRPDLRGHPRLRPQQ